MIEVHFLPLFHKIHRYIVYLIPNRTVKLHDFFSSYFSKKKCNSTENEACPSMKYVHIITLKNALKDVFDYLH